MKVVNSNVGNEGAHFRIYERRRHSGEEHCQSWQDGQADGVTTIIHAFCKNFYEFSPFFIYMNPIHP